MTILYSIVVKAVERFSGRAGLVHERTHTFYRHSLGPESVVVDLGANVGEFAACIAGELGATCYAVEAVSSFYRQIPEDPKIKKFNLAISDRKGPLQLFVSENRECNSIDRSIAEDYGLKGVETCAGTTLEAFLDDQKITSIDLLKIDIEGAERMLFDSTSDEVLRNARQITIEFHDFVPGSIDADEVHRITQRLESLGFYCVPMSYLYPQLSTADILFIQRDKCGMSLVERAYLSALKTLLVLERRKSSLVQLVDPTRASAWREHLNPRQNIRQPTAGVSAQSKRELGARA